MTRCMLLDSWLDAKSKELDEAEEKAGEKILAGVLK